MQRRPAKSFQDLMVWQKAHPLVLSIYRFSDTFPKEEVFGLTSQIRRAGVAIPANIAEGFKRRTKGDKVRFMNIAQGSIEECRYYLILAKDLGYGDSLGLIAHLDEVGRMLNTYCSTILNSDS